MGLFGKSQTEKILDARKAYDRGDATAADVIAVVRESTGNEINAAMDEYGEGTESWSKIR
jgi:hypothetical protein